MTELSANVGTKGLSKSKILVILGIAGVILAGALMFGVFTADGAGTKMNSDSDFTLYQDNSGNTEQLLQNIVNKKPVASAVSESAMVQPVVKADASQMVPPISVVAKEATPEEQAQTDFNKKQLSRKYTSYAAKSLLYSNTPTLSNTAGASSPLSGFKSPGSDTLAGSGQPVMKPASGVNAGSTRQKQFMQDNQMGSPDYLASNLMEAKSPYELKAGSVIPAIMINGLNSDLPGQIIAQVRDNIYDSSTRCYLLIPQGAKLVGLYDNNIVYGQERILVAWNRLIYQDGSSINLKAMPGTDLEGYAGFYDQVDNKYWKIFGTSFIMGVITGAMQYSQNNANANVQVGGIGVTTNTNPTVGQTLSGSLGQQLGQTGLSMTQKNLNVQPTLIVQPNYPFNIMLTADMILRPVAAR